MLLALRLLVVAQRDHRIQFGRGNRLHISSHANYALGPKEPRRLDRQLSGHTSRAQNQNGLSSLQAGAYL